MSEFDYKQPVTTDEYREGIERIFGKKKRPKRESDREKKNEAFNKKEKK